jgi:hypothetical protein
VTTISNSFGEMGVSIPGNNAQYDTLDVYFMGNIPTNFASNNGLVFATYYALPYIQSNAYYVPGSTGVSSLSTYKANNTQASPTFSSVVAWVPTPTLNSIYNYFVTPNTFGIAVTLTSIILPSSGYSYIVKIYRTDVTPNTSTQVEFTTSLTKVYTAVLTAANTSNFLQDGGVYQFSVLAKTSISPTATSSESSLNSSISYNSSILYTINSGYASVSGFVAGLITASIPSIINISGTNYTVNSIGASAFSGCTTLTSITIPTTVTSIGASAFLGCSALTSITIPTSVTSIGASAFSGCSALATCTFTGTSSITTLADSTFLGCSNLGSITIPTTVTSIGVSTFSGCSKLGSISIPYSVTTISANAFTNCTSLTTANIPSLLSSIDSQAFLGCTAFTSFVVDANNSTYSAINGVLCNKSATTLLYYPSGKPETSYIIPSTITTIGDYAFYSNTNTTALVDLTFSNVTTVNNNVFNFTKLKAYFFVRIPTFTATSFVGVTKGTNTFTIDGVLNPSNINLTTYFNSVTNIVAPSNPTLILYAPTANNAPTGLYASWTFATVTLSSYVITVSNGSAEYNITLTDFNATNKIVTTFNDIDLIDNTSYKIKVVATLNNGLALSSAFTSLTLFSKKVLYNTLSSTTALVSGYNSSPTTITIASNIRIDQANCIVTGIAESALLNCNTATNITFPTANTFVSIGAYAFKNCSILTSITLPASLSSIGAFAFDGCNTLTTIDIPTAVTTIGNGAFGNCNNLTSITITGGSSSFAVDSGALYNTSKTTLYQFPSGLTTATPTLPASVTRLGSYCFYGCKNITGYTIPSTINSIGDGPFTSCSSLTQFTIGSGTTLYSVQNSVLLNASKTTLIQYPGGLTNTTYNIPSSVTTIANASFQNVVNLIALVIPTSVTTIGDNAFNGCTISVLEIPYSVKNFGSNAFAIIGGTVRFLSDIIITYPIQSLNIDINSSLITFGVAVSSDVTIELSMASSLINETFLFKPDSYNPSNQTSPFSLSTTQFKIEESAIASQILPLSSIATFTSSVLTGTSFPGTIPYDFLGYVCSSLGKNASAISTVNGLTTYVNTLYGTIDTAFSLVIQNQQATGVVPYSSSSNHLSQLFLKTVMGIEKSRTNNMLTYTPVNGWYKNLTQKGDILNYTCTIHPDANQTGVTNARSYLFKVTLT